MSGSMGRSSGTRSRGLPVLKRASAERVGAENLIRHPDQRFFSIVCTNNYVGNQDQ